MPSTKQLAEMNPDELKAHLGTLRDEFAGIRAADTRDEETVKNLIREVNDADTFLSIALNSDRAEALKHLASLNASVAPFAATGDVTGGGVRSLGERVVNAAATREWIAGGMKGTLKSGGQYMEFETDGGIDVGLTFGQRYGLDPEGGVRAIIGEFGSGGPGNNATNNAQALLPVGQPIPPLPRQARLFMRDLLPVQPTGLTEVPYVRELNPVSLEGGASAVAEGGAKPDVGINLQPETAYVTVVAGNISPTRQLWQDSPLLVAYINQRLPYLVKVRENAELLNGSGTYPDIGGILNTTGVQSQTATSGDPASTIGNSIAKVENVDGSATGVVMNPTDAWKMFTLRASTSGVFDAGNPFMAGAFTTVWGLPVVRSRVITAGTALVGDFARGGMILDREQVNVQVYPQHSDYAAKNAILVQAEERVGVMWFRPDYFVNASL